MFELIEKELEENADPIQAQHSQRYFRTGKGEYGEGDIFMGLKLDTVNKIAKKYKDLNFKDLQKLLDSKYHEKRTTALVILVNLYQNKKSNKKEIVNFYLNNIQNINNWDLVDIACYKILGDYLLNFENGNYDILKQFSKSENLWKRRIAIVSTMVFVKNGYIHPTLEIAKTLLHDKHDLIQKATGWLLREIGKKDENMLKNFLKNNINDISSITLSYAMERLNRDDAASIRLLKKKNRL